jgi:hypothetical protein
MLSRLFVALALVVGLSQVAQAQTAGPRGPVGPQASITCAAGPGVDIVSPSINIQAAVNTHPANTLFCFLPGTYKNVHVTPRSGNKFIAQKGAILDGTNTTQRAFASTSSSTNVTVQNFIVQNYIGGSQVVAIDGQNATDWSILNNEVRYNDGDGIALAGNSIAQYNYLHHNLELGYGSNPGTGIQLLDNEIAFNNYTDKYDCGDQCGGGKLWGTTGAIVSYNYSHDNHGPGFWDDFDNNNITYSFNRSENNSMMGIFHEIGYNASIHDNVILNNGNNSTKNDPKCTWLWCNAILISASGGVSPGLVEIYNNTIVTPSAFGNAVGLVQQNRTGQKGQEPSLGPWLVQNVYVHDNTIDLSKGGGMGGVTDENNTLLYNATLRNIKFDKNHYTLGTNKSPFWWNNKTNNAAAWQKLGFDVNGTFQ